MATLTSFGVIADRGLFSSVHVSLLTRLFAVAAVSCVLVLSARMAGVARKSMHAAIARSNEALNIANKRGALLVEAQQHLERALGLAVGKPGRYTGRLAGPYVIDVIVGVGAMGEIYSAKHVETKARVAVKFLQANAQQRADLVERFLREGAICQSLDSPYLVNVQTVGTLDDGAPYMAMELLQGIDLAARLRKEGSLALPELLELATELAEGLDAAHTAGVVHRDLKDDCNGVVDDQVPGTGVECVPEGSPTGLMLPLLGECRPGKVLCVQGSKCAGALKCSGGVPPHAKVCSIKDNDCDGKPDTDGPCPDPNQKCNQLGQCSVPCTVSEFSSCPGGLVCVSGYCVPPSLADGGTVTDGAAANGGIGQGGSGSAGTVGGTLPDGGSSGQPLGLGGSVDGSTGIGPGVGNQSAAGTFGSTSSHNRYAVATGGGGFSCAAAPASGRSGVDASPWLLIGLALLWRRRRTTACKERSL